MSGKPVVGILEAYLNSDANQIDQCTAFVVGALLTCDDKRHDAFVNGVVLQNTLENYKWIIECQSIKEERK
jgi:hypothetical protein